jgi:hypothetical protein
MYYIQEASSRDSMFLSINIFFGFFQRLWGLLFSLFEYAVMR